MKAVHAAILVTVLLMTLLGSSVLARGSSEDEPVSQHVEEFEKEPRDVVVESKDGEFEIRSDRLDEDSLRVRFRADQGELRLDFTDLKNNSLEVSLRLTAKALVEYLDENSDGDFDLAERVLQDFEVDEMVFEVANPSPLEDGYQIAVEYGLLETDLSFKLVFWIFGNETQLNGILLHPTEVKFDVHVAFFPFESEFSSLALMLELETEVEPQVNRSVVSQVELEALGERYEGFFRWSDTAVVDGVVLPVGSTVIKVETGVEPGDGVEFEVERTVALSYPRGADILHDPVVGVAAIPIFVEPPGPPGPPGPVAGLSYTIYVAALGISALFVVATLLARRRRK